MHMGNLNKSSISKRIAIVHDALVEYGGGEKVLEVLSKMFPNADIYTSFVNYEKIKRLQIPKRPTPTWIQNLSVVKRWPRLIQLLSPLIWPTINLDHYDIVISHGGFYLAHLINLGRKNPSTIYIHYAITPPKNLYIKEYKQWFESPLDILLYPILRYLDKKAVQEVDSIWAVSKCVKARIKKYYERESVVLYPPISVPEAPPPSSTSNRKYYCYAGRLEKEKRIDLIINVFNENKLPLVIVGAGKQEEKLKQLAKPNINFLGFKEPKELNKILLKSKAFIHSAIQDDFPLTPIEAMACGAPVIVHHTGGTKEAVINGKTGMIFKEFTPKALTDTIQKFEMRKFDPKECYKQAKKFSKDRFEKEISKLVSRAYEKSQQN